MSESFLLFVTVGTSGLTNPEIGARTRPTEARGLLGKVRTYLEGETGDEKVGSELVNQLFDFHSDYWNQSAAFRQIPRWFRQTSAELISSARLLVVLKELGHKVGRIVLLSSATIEGRMAAELNGQLLKQHTALNALHTATVEVQEVPQLEAQFIEIVPAIDAILRRHKSQIAEVSGAPPKVIFNITGGFKGVIPSIVVAASNHDAELYYQHESRGMSHYTKFKNGTPEEHPVWGI